MGKSTISTGPFSIANCLFTRGYIHWVNLGCNSKKSRQPTLTFNDQSIERWIQLNLKLCIGLKCQKIVTRIPKPTGTRNRCKWGCDPQTWLPNKSAVHGLGDTEPESPCPPDVQSVIPAFSATLMGDVLVGCTPFARLHSWKHTGVSENGWYPYKIAILLRKPLSFG